MQFRDDSVSEFIRYKLNNPQALQKEMKLIEDRKECMLKLQQYSQQMQELKHELSSHVNVLDVLSARRAYLQQTFTSQSSSIDALIQDSKQKYQRLKRQSKQKQSSSDIHANNFQTFKREIVIKKQKLIEDQGQQLESLNQECKLLRRQNEIKKGKKEELEEMLKKLKDRERIVKNTMENVQKIREKWNTRHAQLETAKEDKGKKEKEVDQLIRYSKSMQKVIYGNLYKRVADVVKEMTNALDSLYVFDNINSKQHNWQQNLESMFLQLKTNRQKILTFLKQKRQNYKINPSIAQSNPNQYNFIVQNKIEHDSLAQINQSDYAIDHNIYLQIEEGQNLMFNRLEEEKTQIAHNQQTVTNEIKSLQRRINEFQEQIDIKRKSLLSPAKKKK